MRQWRPSGLDVFLVVFALADAASVALGGGPHRPAVTVLVVLSLLVFCARHLARPAALIASVMSFALIGLGIHLSPTATGLQFLGMLVVFAVVGVVNRGRELVVAASCGVALLVYGTILSPAGGGWSDFWLSATICLGLLLAGWLLTRRTHQVDRMRAEARIAEERERQRTREALSEERARIARELHDVVSHGLSVVVVQSQAARAVLTDPSGTGTPEAIRHLAAVEGTAREALSEMRRMLGLLHLDESDAASLQPPSPGLAALPGLVERAGDAGVEVRADLPGPDTRLGSGLGLAVYRVVQEGLTNVVKHAPRAATTVRVAVNGEEVVVLVRSGPGRAPGWSAPPGTARRGLVGMNERVVTYGGRLTTGPTPDGGFEVRAELPAPARGASG